MEMTEGIIVTIRKAMGLNEDDSSFDTDLLIHVNSAIVTLNQNGIGQSIMINDTTTWQELKKEGREKSDEAFPMLVGYVKLFTKLLFDPPPPSAVEYHKNSKDEMLWRLRLVYDVEEIL